MKHVRKVKRKVNALLGRPVRQVEKTGLTDVLLTPVRVLSSLVNAIAKVFK